MTIHGESCRLSFCLVLAPGPDGRAKQVAVTSNERDASDLMQAGFGERVVHVSTDLQRLIDSGAEVH